MSETKVTENSYTFVEKATSEMYSVRIKEGSYSGTILTYGKVAIRVDPESDTATLSFTYKVDEANPPYSIAELDKSVEFKNYLGEILSHILLSSFESGNYKIGKPSNVKPTNNHPSEAGQ
jgi:hypothetical protein